LQHPELGERLYAVYCGGDDVFFVGAWDAIMVLAVQIRTDLARYANHPGIHASAGVALITGKHPLFRAAQEADEAEKQSKQSGKNAITFLGEPLKWDDFERTHQNAERFAVWCGKGGVLNRSFLQTLQALHFESDRAQKVAAKRGKKPQYSRATWLAAYQLTRLIEDKRVKDTDAAREVEQIRDSLQKPEANTLSLALAARWAQFMLRTSTSKNKEEA
jgi:CRISPR-associated protein Csm1